MNETLTSATAWAQVEAQGRLAPGEAGWWKVWGARVHDARPGDLILLKQDDEVVHLLVVDTYEAKSYPMRGGIVTDGGERTTIGALYPIILLRQGTHNTLA